MPTKRRLTPFRIVLLLCFALMATAAWFVTAAAMAGPAPLHDYAEDVNALILMHQPPTDGQPNRADEFRQLLVDLDAVYRGYEDEDRFLMVESLEMRSPMPWNEWYKDPDMQHEPARALALEFRQRLDDEGYTARLDELPGIRHNVRLFQTGTDKWLILSDEYFNEQVATLGTVQKIGKDQISIAVYEARAGQTDSAIDRFERTLALARLTSDSPLIISALVAMSLDHVACDTFAYLVSQGHFTDEQLDRIERILDEQHLRPITLALESQRVQIRDTVQRVFASNGRVAMNAMGGAGFAAEPFDKLPRLTVFNIAGYLLPSRAETERAIEAYNDAVDRYLQDPSTIAPDGMSDPAWSRVFERLPYIRQFINGDPPVATNAARSDAVRRGMRLVIALERHRIATGAYPDTLDALVPSYLTELPRDPFARFGSFTYRAPESDGEPYLFYSLGHNHRDDDGTDKGFADIVFSTTPEWKDQ